MKLHKCCSICALQFEPKRNTTGLYCSRRCAWVGRGGSSFNARVAAESADKRGCALRGRGLGLGYAKLNGRHAHRVIAERSLGRPLAVGEVVHHKDGDHRNNAPDNLAVMTQAEHMRLHGIGVAGAQLPWKPWEARWGKSA